MRSLRLILAGLLSLAGLPVGAAAQSPDSAKADLREIVIYQTNDVHGQLGPRPGNEKYKEPPSGGAASLATLLKNDKRPRLYLDSGDWFQGTPVGNMTQGAAVIEAFNALGLDAASIGNHDFDYGLQNAVDLTKKAAFPVLGANVLEGSSQKTARWLEPYVIKTVNGVKVGVMGLLTVHMDELAFPESVRGLRFEREADAARRTVLKMREEGAEVVVALTHMGIEEYREKEGEKPKIYQGIGEGDLYLAENVPGIDVILGGHTHTQIQSPVVVASKSHGGTTVITQTNGRLGSVYQLSVFYDRASGRVESVKGKPVALDPGVYPPDADMQKLVARHEAAVAERMKESIGQSAVGMLRPREGEPQTGEMLLGSWVTDAMRRWGKTQIALLNTFGLRGDLPKGPLTYGHAYGIMPFDNAMVKLEIKGSEFRKMVEKSLQDDVTRVQYSGVEIVWDPSKPYQGGRAVSVKVGGVALDDAATYTVTTMDFVALVDQAMAGIEKRITEKSPLLARDLLIAEIRKSSPITAELDGRVRALKP